MVWLKWIGCLLPGGLVVPKIEDPIAGTGQQRHLRCSKATRLVFERLGVTLWTAAKSLWFHRWWTTSSAAFHCVLRRIRREKESSQGYHLRLGEGCVRMLVLLCSGWVGAQGLVEGVSHGRGQGQGPAGLSPVVLGNRLCWWCCELHSLPRPAAQMEKRSWTFKMRRPECGRRRAKKEYHKKYNHILPVSYSPPCTHASTWSGSKNLTSSGIIWSQPQACDWLTVWLWVTTPVTSESVIPSEKGRY